MMEDEDPEIAELQAQAFWSRRYQGHDCTPRLQRPRSPWMQQLRRRR